MIYTPTTLMSIPLIVKKAGNSPSVFYFKTVKSDLLVATVKFTQTHAGSAYYTVEISCGGEDLKTMENQFFYYKPHTDNAVHYLEHATTGHPLPNIGPERDQG